MDENNSPGSCEGASSTEESQALEGKGPKICLVCGDKAKSHHFGGLCCESCKAFFRRSMQHDCYKSFLCIHGQSCKVRKDNRRNCQYCRIKKCFSIGMEKGWLRTDEEITRMKELKLVNSAKATTPPSAKVASPPTCVQTPALPSPVPYQPRYEDIHLHLSPGDVQLIETIVDSYWKAYKAIPFGPEVTQNSAPRTGLQVISMFTTGIRRWAAFARSRPEYISLCRQDQATILQAAVMQLSILRAVASFQMGDKEWRINTPVAQFTPSLKLEDVQRLLSPQLAEIHLVFITSMHKLNVDEALIMLLSLIVLFTAERDNLIDRQAIAYIQDGYILLLKRYCDWKYGPDDKGRTFANLLAKLSDLRELSDLHSDHQVRFANQDLVKLYQEIDAQPVPSVNMDLNNTNHFLSAMELSILKTPNHTLPSPEPLAHEPVYRNLEQIEDLCANMDEEMPPVEQDGNSADPSHHPNN